MKVGAPLLVQGSVSAKLLQNLDRIQSLFHNWYPEFHKIPVRATEVRQSCFEGSRAVGSSFSAGVDSHYTALSHQEEIDYLIHLHGFDVRLHEEAFRAQVEEKIELACRLLGKRRIEVETNVRDFGDPYTKWDYHNHGAGLASAALLLEPVIGKIYVAATHAYAQLIPWGSHPLLDPLWSTEDLTFVHDGCGTYRFEKIERLARSQAAMKTLRVCLDRRSGRYNCCRCYKCLRTMVSLKAIGALEKCETFESSLDLKALKRMKVSRENPMIFARENLIELDRLGNQPELARILRNQIAGQFIRQLRRRLKELQNHSAGSSTWRDWLWMIQGKTAGRTWKRASR
jgi:hypothetical protein